VTSGRQNNGWARALLGNIAIEPSFGVVVCEQTGVLELPSEDVHKEDNGLGLGAILWCCDVGLQVIDALDWASGGSLVDFAREAAFAHTLKDLGFSTSS
jgi:hypothetical protein